jgi:hypothetical protein
MSFYTHKRTHKMLTISKRMLEFVERLAEMFPSSSYQSKLDEYLSDKHITDAAQLEHYIRKFDSRYGAGL